MARIDVSDVKKKILSFLDQTGPSLPIPIAKHVSLQPMFASAILSELLNEKRIKTSSMKIGSSPLYFTPGQEAKLENFTENLTGAEKEAYLKLRDNKFLEDQTQEPRTRVALRALKDFAIPTQINNKLYWKYFTVPNEKIRQALEDEGEVAIGERVVGQQIWEDIKKGQPKIETVKTKQEEIVEILTKESSQKTTHPEDKPEETIEEPKTQEIQNIKPTKIKKLTEKEIFLDQAKRILASKNIELLEIIQYDKKQLIAKARVSVDKTCILFFIDKKRPDEKDLIRAYKKSQEHKLPYYIVTQTQPPKKLKETADVYKSLLGFGSIE